MSINIVMVVKDRPRLTRQALETLVMNTDVDWNLTLVDDESKPETRDYLRIWSHDRANVALLRNEKSKGIVGQVKNLGVYWSKIYFGGARWLCLCDNDIAFLPDWASTMISNMEHPPIDINVMGGCQHPYHKTNLAIRGMLFSEIHETDAVAGYHQFMPSWIFESFGPLDAHAVGTGQSEDFAFCRKILANNSKVGYIHPPVVTHTGITNTAGQPAIGAEQFTRVPGYLYE